MHAYGKGTLDDMRTTLANTFSTAIASCDVIIPPLGKNRSLTLVARFLACPTVGIFGDLWLGIDVLLPGDTQNEGLYSPTLLRPSVSFYCKDMNYKNNKRKSDKIQWKASELPVPFFAANLSWFQENNFVDVAFGYKEHGYMRILAKGAPQAYFRPTRFWNIAEAGHVTDLIVEFVRMWCKV